MTGVEGTPAHIHAQYPGYESYPGFDLIQDRMFAWNIRQHLVIHVPYQTV